jgi:hypothetical protein
MKVWILLDAKGGYGPAESCLSPESKNIVMRILQLTSFFAAAFAFFAIGTVDASSSSTAGPPEQRIDQLIDAKLKEMKLEPNPEIDDATFLRRAHLDIIGRVPTIEEAEAFSADPKEDRRRRLIEGLLNSEGYVSHYYNFWADILRINTRLGINETPPAVEYAYRLWLKSALRENTPYNSFVRELVSARGKFWENSAIGYYQRDRGMPLENMSNTVRIFLGTRLECAQCHDHPFDHWTQLDYYKMAAFSYGMDSRRFTHANREALHAHLDQTRLDIYSGGIEAIEEFEAQSQGARRAEDILSIRIRNIITTETERPLELPHDYKYSNGKPFDVVAAGTMFGQLENASVSDIDAYADWMTSKENPTFTRVIANRLWKKVFGVGIFEPTDEITDSTFISNPELLSYLEVLMHDFDYDMKAFLSVLFNTKTYQRASKEEQFQIGTPSYFQGPEFRRMSAEQIWDSVVGLVLPEVDYYSPDLNRQLADIDRVRTIYQSLAEIPKDEFIAAVEELRDTMATNLTRKNLVDEQRRKAYAEKNDDLFQQKSEELKVLQSEVADKISSIQRTRHRDIAITERLASFGMVELSTRTDGELPVSEDAKISVVTIRHKPIFPKPPPGLESNQFKVWRAVQAQEYKDYLSLGSNWARASELTSPAPRGHFLREFGQSDRDVIENAASGASVPQALNLLNGPMAEALTNRFGILGRRIHEAETPDEKIEVIFQGMLTRAPTTRERQLALAHVKESGEQAYQGIVLALLNTQQFIFIQ